VLPHPPSSAAGGLFYTAFFKSSGPTGALPSLKGVTLKLVNASVFGLLPLFAAGEK